MMALTIENSTQKILVVGAIYNKIDKLQNLQKIEDNYDLIIINGNMSYPYDNIDEIQYRIDYFKNLPSKYIYNLGNHDLEFMAKNSDSKIESWFRHKPNTIIVNFKNQTRLIVVNGGVSPKMNKQDLDNNLEISFISKINGESWHKVYGGGYGYIISNQPFTNEIPCFYNYSAQIGNIYNADMKIYGQEVDQYGLKETILI